MKQNSNLNHLQQLLFYTFPPSRLLINKFFLASQKTGAKTTHRVPKLGYFDGREPKVSSRVTLCTRNVPAGVVCHMTAKGVGGLIV